MLPDHLHHAAVLLTYGHEKVVQPGRFAAPKLRLVDGKLEVLRFATALRRREYGFPIHQRRVQGCAFRTLTQQERRIVYYLSSGMKNEQIAEELHISIYTVRTHIANIYKKFEVNNKVDLLMHLQPIMKEQGT